MLLTWYCSATITLEAKSAKHYSMVDTFPLSSRVLLNNTRHSSADHIDLARPIVPVDRT